MFLKQNNCLSCFEEFIITNKHSSQKYCLGCSKKRKSERVKEFYHKCKNSGNLKDYQLRSSQNEKVKRETNIPYRLWSRAKRRAQTYGLEFNIDIEDVSIPELCPYLKVPMVYKTYYTPSLDRVDSGKGYIKDNIQVISHKANAMKNSATQEELISFAKHVLTQVQKEPDVFEVK